jgi:hypothetical protein
MSFGGGEYISRLTVIGSQTDNVAFADQGDGTGQHGLAVRAQTDFSGNIGREPLAGTVHQFQGGGHTLVGKNVEKRRLLQMDRQCLLQRVIQKGIACQVDKVGDDDAVVCSQMN